jgi:predicted MFS family arabinose efflux permease
MTATPTTVRKPQESAAKGAKVALILLTAMNFVNYLDRYILPAVQEQVKGEFRITDDQLGSLTTWFFFAYVLSSPLTAWLGEKFPRKTVIVIAALAISAMNFFTASVHNYMSLNIRHAALGVGEACFGIFAPTLLADFFAEDQRNKVLTIFNVAIPVGAAMGYLVGGMIGHSHGWRMAFIASAIPGAVIALLILFFMREPARAENTTKKAKADKASVLSLATNGAYLTSILGYAAVTFSMGGISWWMVSFLQRMNGYSQDKAGTVMGGITVVCGLGGTVCGGILAQWWSKKTDKALYLVPALSAILAVPPAMLCFFGPKTLTLPALGVAMFVIFLGTGPVNAATLNAVPANLRATAMAGQLFTIHVLGDAFSPKIIGIISDHSSLRLGLGSTLVTFLLAGVIFFIGSRYAPKLHHSLEASAA